jgi:hypothetical protein
MDTDMLLMMKCVGGKNFATVFQICVFVVAVLVGASPATAQSTQQVVDGDLARAAEKLKVGDTVVVTTETGMQIRGRFLKLSPRGFVLHVNNVERQLPSAQVSRIELRRNGVTLGALVGAAVGVPFGLALKSYAYNEGGSEAWALAFPILVGLGTGLAFDAFLVIPRTVFDRLSPRATVVPIVTPHTTGVRVAITF